MAEASTTHPQAEPEHPREQQEPKRFSVHGPRLALFGILVLAVLMDFYRLGQDGFGSYYPPAVRSMVDNWHNFFFAAYDPGGFTSLDKPPVGFWFQVLSAKIFGLNTVSVLLPQALAGVLSVFLLYYLVRRHFGVVAGLIAALALAISPISVVTNRNATIDSTLTLCLLLGAWAVMRAAETGRLRWLLLTAVIVGIGFNIKMLEAYLVVPAFGLLYLLAAPTSIRKRVLHLALALLVLLVVSCSWVLAVDLTPASQRPYVGNTQDDSELSLALGYNGIGRLLGLGRGKLIQGNGGSAQPSNGSSTPPAKSAGGPGATGGPRAPGPLRLFAQQPLAGQTGWQLPLAILGLVALAWQGRPRPREDRHVHSLLLWGMWLLTMGIFFSVAGFIHEYYLTVMAPAIAALCGIGLVVMWRDYRGGGWRGWLLPAALLLTAAEQIVLLASYPTWGKFLIPLLTIPCLLAAGMLISARIASLRTGKAKAVRLLLPALVVGLIALVFAPIVWAALPILQGTESDLPLAGPARGGNGAGLAVQGAGGTTTGEQAFQNGGLVVSPGGQATADPALVRYLEEHQGHAHVLVATDVNADALILATNRPVMPLSGFSSYPLTASEAASLVASGTVRFFLLTSGGGGPHEGGPSSVTSWVAQHCAIVSPSLWQSPLPSPPAAVSAQLGTTILYDCATLRR
ncbi:glycosyltransferase family 39 protein [Ktedonobacter racemifer]|uniref:Glycosyl transferase family 39 n=1 Tax=Ktedonobacter racemifer DSM 44963 TaxID=485913 RepID=D6TYK4_KTERA|nr:glycosyltransferase family 39 protein [Ktedonobacter racemifer]EFH85079.1 glycosyl transferase family 39 [Ktedonobacter racemifer DSM 44963]